MTSNKIYIFIQLDGAYVPAGILQQSSVGRGFSFRYGNRYIQRPNALAIDPISLPLSTEQFQSPQLFSVFRDASPDRWGRRLLSIMAQKHYGEMTELEILTALHSVHRMGALAFGNSPEAPCSMATWAQNSIQDDLLFMPMEKLEDVIAILRKVDALEDESLVLALQESLPKDVFLRALASSLSLGGARPKAFVRHQDGIWIAKFSKHGDPWNEPRIEYATMLLAERCGITIPELDLRSFPAGDVLLLRRFDRLHWPKKGSHPQKEHARHVISGFTLNRLDEDGDWGSYQNMAITARRYGAFCQEELFRRMVFNMLCSNRDDHPRNHAFFVKQNSLELTPAYDIVPCALNIKPLELALRCGKQGRVATIENMLSNTAPFGLSTERAEAILMEMRSITAQWKEHYRQHGVSEKDVAMLEARFSI